MNTYYCNHQSFQNRFYDQINNIMNNQEEYLICSKHNRAQFIDEKFCKNTFICINRYCQYGFELACNRCRTEFHRDHITKFLSLQSFKSLVDQLVNDDIKRSTQQGYDYYKRLNIIKEFRKRMQVIETQLTESIHQVIINCLGIDQQYKQYKGRIEEYQHNLNNIQNPSSIKTACSSLKQIGKLIDFNLKRGILQYQSPKLKELEEKVRKSLDKSSKEMEQIKEHTMKIIEVILHQLESDDEIELNIIRKKFKVYMDKENEKSTLKSQYKQIIDDLVEEINKKSNELEGWLAKAEVIEPKIRQNYNDSVFVKVYEIAEQNEQIHNQNQALTKQNQQLKQELDDLKKKVARMNERIGEFKKALFQEDEKFKYLKQEHQKITGKPYIVPDCIINIDLLRNQAHKLANSSQQRLDLLRNRNSKQVKQTTKTQASTAQQQQITFFNNLTQRTEAFEPQSKQNIISQSRIAVDDKRQHLITHMLNIITEQQKANQKWVGICQSKNQTILSLKTKLKSLIDSSRAMILNQ